MWTEHQWKTDLCGRVYANNVAYSYEAVATHVKLFGHAEQRSFPMKKDHLWMHFPTYQTELDKQENIFERGICKTVLQALPVFLSTIGNGANDAIHAKRE